ncbi:MAG: N-acetyltransferase [Candidatus Helarchaeota archaeon]|nr:N-acetyltransferase [Candidatus Helarchaeota archaeon]
MNLISKEAEIGKNVKIGHNVIIEDGVIIDDNVKIDHNAIVRKNVHLGSKSYIGANVILGEYIGTYFINGEDETKLGYYKDPEIYENPILKIGEKAKIRANTIIYADSEIGDKFETGSWTVIRNGCKIGNNNYLGNHCEIWPSEIGDHNRFISVAHIGDMSVIGDCCWFLPYATLATDLHPPCGKCLQGPVIEDYAIIGSFSLILPRLRIGKNAIVGACSLVTQDVPPETIVVGNPAKAVKNIKDVTCPLGIIDKGPYPWYENMPKKRRKRYGYPD